jgi:dTDP-D-glucose 4,6-dehydratase
MIEFIGDRSGHDSRYSLKFDKILGLGWKPEADFDGRLQKTINWCKANKWWWHPPVIACRFPNTSFDVPCPFVDRNPWYS